MAPTPGQTKKFGEKLLSGLKRSAPYLAAAGTGIAGGVGGYHLGKAVERRNDTDEDRQIAEQFYNLGERNSIMKTSELLDNVYENAFVNELEKLGAKNPVELAKQVMPWVKNVFGKAKGGVVSGVKELGEQYANMGKRISQAGRQVGDAAQFKKGTGKYQNLPNFQTRLNRLGRGASYLGKAVTENPAAAITTGVGVSGLAGGGVMLARGMKKED